MKIYFYKKLLYNNLLIIYKKQFDNIFKFFKKI